MMDRSERRRVDARDVSRRDALKEVGLWTALAAGLSVGSRSALASSDYAPPPAYGPHLALRIATNYAGAQTMAKPFAEVIKQFQADYPSIRVTHEATPGFDHQTKIKLDGTSNRLPDIFSFWR